MTVEFTESDSEVFRRFIATEYAYFTPKGEPLCWPVTPYWYPDRGVLAIATGLAYPTKADYAALNPKVALLFSDPTGSGLPDESHILVQGDARVLSEDMQANADRYVTELRARFLSARIGINPLTVRLLDFYLPRLWVEIDPVAVERRKPNRPADGDLPRAQGLRSNLDAKDVVALRNVVTRHGQGVVTIRGSDGYPQMLRTSVTMQDDLVLLRESPGTGAACLTMHQHTLRGTRFSAYMVRGELVDAGEAHVFIPRRLVGFFGNGAVFPLSVIPSVGRLRRRLGAELARRGKEMPKLRIP
ncbi:MAG TPA: hypothetical protein VI541_05550 [Actinomycetota bacterium]|nr:hypothetical protein [Actinomycetota bacterium]